MNVEKLTKALEGLKEGLQSTDLQEGNSLEDAYDEIKDIINVLQHEYNVGLSKLYGSTRNSSLNNDVKKVMKDMKSFMGKLLILQNKIKKEYQAGAKV